MTQATSCGSPLASKLLRRGSPPRVRRPQQAGDLGRFDTNTADFHLVIQPASDVQQTIRPITANISRAVDQIAGVFPKRIGEESLPRLVRIEVAETAERSANGDFPDFANTTELVVPAKDQRLGIFNRATNWLDALDQTVSLRHL